MDSFLRGLREGAANSLRPQSIAQKPATIQYAEQELEEEDPLVKGIADAFAASQQGRAAALGTFGNPDLSQSFDIGSKITPVDRPETQFYDNLFNAEVTRYENELAAPPTSDGTFNVTWDVKPDGTRKYNNFPDRDITIDEMNPSILLTLNEQGLHYHSNVTNFVMGVMWKPVYNEDGTHKQDKNGNPLWEKNDSSNWTPEDWEQYKLAEAEMGQINNDLGMMRQGAEENGWDFRNTGQILEDGTYQSASLDPFEIAAMPNEWTQNKAADAWYRKNILGEDVPWYDDLIQVVGEGGSGIGNFMGGIFSWVTPGTENTTPNFNGFNEWAAKQDPALLKRLYEDGWDPYGTGDVIYGGAAVWDAYAWNLTNSQKGFIDTFTDLLTYIPVAGGTSRAVAGTARGSSRLNRIPGLNKITTPKPGSVRDVTTTNLDRMGRGALWADDAMGNVVMKPLLGTVKAPLRLARRVTGRFGDEAVQGWEAGRWNARGDQMVANERAIRGTSVDEEIRLDNQRRWGFDEKVMGDDFIPMDVDAEGRRVYFNQDNLTRVERTFHDAAMTLNRGSRRMGNVPIVGRLDDLLFQQRFQEIPEDGANHPGLADVARNTDVSDRARNTILRDSFDEQQMEAHRVTMRGGRHPLIPDKNTPISRDQLRREYQDIHQNIDPEIVQSSRNQSYGELQASLRSLGNGRGRTDYSADIQEVLDSLGYLAPDHTRPDRNLGLRRIENIDEILQELHPNARQDFYQEYARVVSAFRESGLITQERGGYVSPRQTAYSQVAIEEAWRRSFGNQPNLLRKLPKYEFKDFPEGTIQDIRKRGGRFAINSAFESIVHGSDLEAQKGFIYLQNIPGFQDMALEAESIRWAMNQIRQDSGVSGSPVFRNQESDRYFTGQAPTRNWDPTKGMMHGPWEIKGPISGNRKRSFDGYNQEPAPDPNADLQMAQTPYRPRQNESGPVSIPGEIPRSRALTAVGNQSIAVVDEPVINQISRRIEEQGIDNRVSQVREAIANDQEIPKLTPEREPIDPSVNDVEIPEDEIPVRMPPRSASLVEAVKDANARFYRRENHSAETIADAQQRISVMRASGMVSEDDFNYWARETGQNPVQMFKHLSMIAQRNQSGLGADGIFRAGSLSGDGMFDLSTPLERLPRKGFVPPKTTSEFTEEIRGVLDAANLSDNLELSDRVIRAIEDMTISQEDLGTLKAPELNAPDYIRNKFANDIRSLENSSTILKRVALSPKDIEARMTAVKIMSHLTSSYRDWPPRLKKILDAVGINVAKDLEKSVSWTGYTHNVDNALNRLVTITRHVVAGNYLAEGMSVEDVARLLSHSLRDIDEFAQSFLDTATNRYRDTRNAREWIRGEGYLVKNGREGDWGVYLVKGPQGQSHVHVNLPEIGVTRTTKSYHLAAQHIMRARGMSESGIPFNDIDSAFGVDELVDGRTPYGWRGERKAAPMVPVNESVSSTSSFPESMESWDASRIAAEIDGARDLLRKHNNHYSSYSITALSKESFLENPGDAFRIRVNEQLDDPRRASQSELSEATDKVYKEARDGAQRYESLLGLYDFFAEWKYQTGELTASELRGFRFAKLEDPRLLRNRTPMQERQANLLDANEAVSEYYVRSNQYDNDWIAYHRAMGNDKEVERLLKDMERREDRRGSNRIVMDNRGYARISGDDIRQQRAINDRIYRAQAAREDWAPSGGHLTEEEDVNVKVALGTIRTIRASIPEYDELLERYDALTEELRKAPRLPESTGPSSRYLNPNDRPRINRERQQIAHRIQDAFVESGMEDEWEHILRNLFQADSRVKARIQNAINFHQGQYDNLKKQIREATKNVQERNQMLERLDEKYFGKLIDGSSEKFRRDGSGLISKLMLDRDAIMADQGYGARNPKTGERGKWKMENAYLRYQVKVGRLFENKDFKDGIRELLWLSDIALKEAKEDPRKVRADVAKKVRMGLDLDPGEEAIAQANELYRVTDQQDPNSAYMPPREINVSRSPSQMLGSDSTYNEVLPDEGVPSVNPQAMAEEQHALYIANGMDPDSIPTVDEMAKVIEIDAMEAEGYTWVDNRIYLPADHPLMTKGVWSGFGEDFQVHYLGATYRDIFDLIEMFPEFDEDIVRSLQHLEFIRRSDGRVQSTSSLDRAIDDGLLEGGDYNDTLEPSRVDRPFEDLVSRDDWEIYSNFNKVMGMDPEQRVAHLRDVTQELLENHPDLYDLLEEKIYNQGVAQYVSTPTHGYMSPDIVDESTFAAIWEAVARDLPGFEGPGADLVPRRLLEAINSPQFGQSLDARVNPKNQNIEARKSIHGGWSDTDLDSRARYEAAMARARDEANLEDAAEKPKTASHRTGRRRGRTAQPPARIHSGWTNKSGPVTSKDVEDARNFLDNLETYDNGNTIGFMYQTPWARAQAMKEGIEYAESIVRADAMDRARRRYQAETDVLQDQADETRRRAAGNRYDSETGNWSPNVDEGDYREIRPVDNPDRYIHDDTSVALANTRLKSEGYYKNYTYLEAYKSIRSKNINNGQKLVDLMNEKAQYGTLSREKQLELERLQNRYRSYGDVVVLNPNRGSEILVDRGVAKATTREGRDAVRMRDMRMYIRNEDFPMDQVSRREMEDLLYRDQGRELVAPRYTGLVDKYDRFVSWWSRNKLMNPLNIVRFLGMNTVGDYGQMLFTGNGDAVLQSLKTLGNGELRTLLREAGKNSIGDMTGTQIGDLIYYAGIGPNVTEIRGSMTGQISKHLDTRLRRVFPNGELEDVFEKAPRKIGFYRVGSYSELAGQITTALEWNRRYAVFFTDFQRRMVRRHNNLPIEIIERASKMGIDGLEADMVNIMVKDLGHGTSSSVLQARMMELGGAFSSASTNDIKKWADRVARDWANGQRVAMDESVEKVNSVLFSYKMTDIDEAVRKFMPFHYWATRALPLYADIAIRNPYLMTTYIRAVNAMDNQRERGETPGFMSTVTEFFMSPAGFAAFTNPLAAIGMVSLFSDVARTEGIDDETFLGTMTRLAGDYGGVNLYPWFSSALNMTGWLGTTNKGLDPTGFARERRFMGGVYQSMVSTGMMPGQPARLLGKPFEQRLREGRAILSKIIPGGAEIEATNANASTEVSFQYLMENIIRERDGMGKDTPLSVSQQEEIVLAWENPDDPLYQEALKTYSNGNFLNNALNVVMPSYLSIQPENAPYLEKISKDEQPLPEGVTPPPGGRAPGEGYETTGFTQREQIWLDSWYRATGEEYEDGDLDQWKTDTKLRKDLLWLTPEAQRMTIDQYKYDNLGTQKQQDEWDLYYQIVFGNLPDYGTLTISEGNVQGYGYINDMTAAERQAIADEWIQSDEERYERHLSLRDLRKSFRGNNPEFDEYQAWRWSIQNTDNYPSLAAYRSSISKDSPNAARYFAEQRKDLVARYGTDIDKINEQLDWRTTSMEAYFAVHGHRYSRSDGEALPGDESGFDPISNPRVSNGSGGVLGQANAYLTDMYGTTVRLETMPPSVRGPLIGLLPADMQESVRREIGN